MTLRRRIPAAIVLVLWTGFLLPAQSPAIERLIQLLNTPDFLDKDNAVKELLHAAIDAGPAVVPELRNLLQRSNDDERKSLVLGALTLVGGSEAISILQKEYENGNAEAGVALAFAMASVDSKQSREMLIRLLTKDPGDENEIVVAAAYSLGLLRASEAVPGLRKLAEGSPNRDTTDVAKLALQWIEKGFWTIRSQPNDERQSILAAVLKVGIPDENYEYFFDEEGGGFWRYSPTGWTFSSGNPQNQSPSGPEVDDIFLSSDGSRVFVSLSIHCGLRCGAGYGYSLRKEGRDWKVQMLMMLWIA